MPIMVPRKGRRGTCKSDWVGIPGSIALSALTVATAATAGTVVGSLSISGLVSDPALVWVYSLDSGSSASFAVSGSNIVTVGTLTAGVYQVYLRAKSGVNYATQTVSITVA